MVLHSARFFFVFHYRHFAVTLRCADCPNKDCDPHFKESSVFTKRTTLGALAFVLATATAAHAKDLTALAKELANLRQEVAELENQLGDKRAQYRAQEDSLSRQVAEMEGDVRREELVLEKVRLEINSREKTHPRDRRRRDSHSKAVLDSCDQLEQHIKNTLPFKRTERLASVSELRKQIKSEVLSPRKAASNLGYHPG